MDDDNSLNISITAIDEASDVFDSVSEEASAMGDALASTAEEINGSLDSMTSSTEGFSAAFEASVAAYEASVAGMGVDTATTADAVSGSFDDMSASAVGMATDWDAAMGDALSSLGSLDQVMAADSASISEDALAAGTSFDDAAAMIVGGNAEIEESSATMYSTMKNAGLLALGIAADQVGTQLQDFYKTTVTTAAGADSAQASLGQTITDNISLGQQLSNSDSSIAQQKQFVIDQINAQSAAMEAAATPISAYNKTTAQLASDEATASAKYDTARDSLETLTGTLDKFNNLEVSAGDTLAQVNEQFDAAATANEQLGFTYTDTLNALAMGNTALGDSKEALEENAIAMDLVALKGGTLENATDALNKAFAGSGFALYQYGINVKQGISGNDVLQAVMQQVAGAAAAQAATMGGALNIMNADWQQLLTTLGNSQQGVLAPLFETIEKIVTELNAWAEAHPELTTALLLFVGALGTALVIFGTVVTVLAAIALAVQLVGEAFLGSFALGVGIVATLAVGFALFHTSVGNVIDDITKGNPLVTLFQEQWKQLSDTFVSDLEPAVKNLWTALQPFMPWLTAFVQALGQELVGALTLVGAALVATVNGLTLLLTAATNVSTFLVGALDYAFKTIKTDIQDIVNLVQDLISLMSQLVGGKGGGGGNIGSSIASSIGSLLSNSIPFMAEGGIVSSPTLAMIGEAGPEAVVPLNGFGVSGSGAQGGGAINIYITGTIQSTSTQARNLANEIASQLNRSLKVQSFR